VDWSLKNIVYQDNRGMGRVAQEDLAFFPAPKMPIYFVIFVDL